MVGCRFLKVGRLRLAGGPDRALPDRGTTGVSALRTPVRDANVRDAYGCSACGLRCGRLGAARGDDLGVCA